MKAAPTNYTLEFEPDLENFTFAVRTKIQINCTGPTSDLTLDCAELAIQNAALLHKDKSIQVRTKLDKKKEKLHIHLDKKIRGKAELYLECIGILNDRLLGFYRSKYGTKYLATTQFEAADARRAFPCWDEPEAKATFDITIITKKIHTAISNMPVKSTYTKNSKTHHTFAQTPVMSTYLVYLGVGEFEFLTGKQGKITVRVVTTKGNKSRGRYALHLGKKLIRAYEEYFGIKYPLPKLDLIAIPDFAAGAMENWGAITFRETILLYDPKTSSTRTKQFIAEVISHEIAHQWFGNLVTMKWWNDLWLNESFATYMATKFVDQFYPEWEMWDQFTEDAMNTAMNLDALRSSHPIDVPVKSPSEIREIFDAISYDKGGCILRMLEDYVTESKFRRGLKAYLKKYSYKNAEGADLWDEIGKIAHLPVKSMINTWIRQVGFPVLHAEERGKKLAIHQERFLAMRTPRKGRWSIPVSIKHGKSHRRILLKRKSANIQQDPDYIINYGRKGFYRVRYDKKAMYRLGRAVAQKSIPHIDRWAIQNDLYALCMAGMGSLREYLDFTDSYARETSYMTSSNVAGNLDSLQYRTREEPYAGHVMSYTIRYFTAIFNRLGWDAKKGEKHTDALLRGRAISALGRLGDHAILKEAQARFKKFLKNPDSLPADIREPVYSLAAHAGGTTMHARLVTLYKNAKSQEEKMRFLGALCAFQDERLLLKTLEFSQTPAVRSQNMQLPIIRVAANPHGKKILWPWLKKNWKGIAGKVGYGNPLLNRIVGSLSLVADHTMDAEIRRFFAKNPAPGTERTLKQTLERIQINHRFLVRTRKEFAEYT